MRKKRIYVFDWDDNIIHMPTTMKMEQLVDDVWVSVDISTRNYAEIRNDPNYRYPINITDPYLNFSNDQQFIKDLEKALDDKTYGPSFLKFKECLMYGHNFSIITARGQSINVIMAGIIMLIGKSFSAEEMSFMINNIGCVSSYLSKQVISPVTSPEMSFPQFNDPLLKDTVESRKVIALDSYIDTIVLGDNHYTGKFSVGFSDDDQKNVNTIREFIKKTLKLKHPELHFVVYDTSNPEEIIKILL